MSPPIARSAQQTSAWPEPKSSFQKKDPGSGGKACVRLQAATGVSLSSASVPQGKSFCPGSHDLPSEMTLEIPLQGEVGRDKAGPQGGPSPPCLK